MIFDCNLFCTVAEQADHTTAAPFQLGGEGLWVGVLSSGNAALAAGGRAGQSGDLLLGAAPLALQPQGMCHILAVRLTGSCTDQLRLAVGEGRFADGAACPGAAELLAQLCRSASSPTAYALLCALAHADEPARPLPPLVREAVQAIRQNYMALYGVEELSEQLGVSKSHLVRVFGEEMGLTPGRYLMQVRLDAVKALLLQNEYNLDTIAGLCGFSGANYLCRVFKKELGVSPAAWRAAALQPTAPTLPLRGHEMYV